MGPPATQQGTDASTSRWSQEIAFLSERLGAPVVTITSEFDARLVSFLPTSVRDGPPEKLRFIERLVGRARVGRVTVYHALVPGSTLVISPLPNSPVGTMLVTLLPHSAEVSNKLVAMACEVLDLRLKSQMQKVQIEASSHRSARRYEDQRWLRDLARSVAISSDSRSIESLIKGVLAPVRGSLRAEGLYLLSSQSGSVEYGLPDTKFGQSAVTNQDLRELMAQLGVTVFSSPIVLNHAALLGGSVNSLLAIPLTFEDQPMGILVAINRSAKDHRDGSNLSAREFSCAEMALLEDAGVLLCSQSHNLQFLIESQLLVIGSLRAMSRAIDARDKYTQGHSERVARLSYELAKILGLTEGSCQEIYISGILHDIGKIGIPDSILLKNGPLTDEEFGVIKKHPEIGHQIIEQMGKLRFVLPGVLYHHERWDGNGYPHGLRGASIPLMARVLAVADSFDAMTSSRPYRNAMPTEKACEIITSGANIQWDSAIVDCFLAWRKRRDGELESAVQSNESFIPLGVPYEGIAQSVLTLGI